MAWRRPGDKLLSEPTMVRLPTHIWVTRSQWIKADWRHMLGNVITDLFLICVLRFVVTWNQLLKPQWISYFQFLMVPHSNLCALINWSTVVWRFNGIYFYSRCYRSNTSILYTCHLCAVSASQDQLYLFFQLRITRALLMKLIHGAISH